MYVDPTGHFAEQSMYLITGISASVLDCVGLQPPVDAADYSEMSDTLAYQVGRLFGDIVSTSVGIYEFLTTIAELAAVTAGGLLLAPASGGVSAAGAIALDAVLVAKAGASLALAYNGLNNLVSDSANFGNRHANLSPKGAGRRCAYRKTKRKNNVPMSEQPKVKPNVDKRGNKQPGKIYEFENGTNIRDDAAGHKFPDDPTQNREHHFNDSNGNHFDY